MIKASANESLMFIKHPDIEQKVKDHVDEWLTKNSLRRLFSVEKGGQKSKVRTRQRVVLHTNRLAEQKAAKKDSVDRLH